MNKDQFTRKLESLESAPLEATQNILSEIIQLIQTAGDDLPAVNWGLLKLSETITRTKEVEPIEKIKYYEILFKYVIETALKYDLQIGSEALRLVFDSSSEFYRKNLHDNSVQFPLSKDRPINHYYPIVGEQCDAVRPGLTTISRMGWTRCKILNISNSGVYSLKFFNSNDAYNISESYWFAPLGERTQQFDWRVNLKVGDLIDGLDNKNVWYLSTIVETKEDNGCKSVRVSFRYFDENGDKTDSDGKTFFGWGANQDDWIDLSSPRIQRPRTMLRKLCYYASSSHNEFVMDDNSDIVFLKEYQQKPFYSMLRSGMTRSQMIYSLWNFFIAHDGLVKISNILKEGKNIDSIFNMAIALSLACFMVPKMATQQLFSQYLKDLIDFVKNNSKMMNNQRMDMCFWTLEALGKRCMTLCQKHDMIEDLKRFLVPRFFTMNLQKQLLALKCLYDLIKPMRPHTEKSEQELVDYLRQNNIFYLAYQQNQSHEQVLYRSTQLLEYMLKKNIISLKQIDHLWNMFPLNDAKARVTLQKLISDVVHQMGNQHINYILQRLIDIQSHQITMDHLQLLNVMKTKNKLQGQNYIRALDLLWQLLTTKSATVKASVEAEVEKIFKSFITNILDERVKFQLLNSMINCLKQTTNIQKQPSFLKQYILSYPTQESAESNLDYPTTRYKVVSYLCQKDIYNICIKHLSNTKIQHKVQQILNLLSTLIQNDKLNNLSLIARQVYQILGPSQMTLKWLSSLSKSIHKFIQQLFIQTTDYESFSNISLASLNSLSSMFNDVNALQGKRKYVKQKLQICDIGQIEWNSYTFTKCKPEELLGMRFMENLLQVPQNAPVYAKLVEFIVKLNVHLDQSLFENVQEIRKQFLNSIISQFQQINEKGELNEKTKHRLLSRINLLNQFIDQTEIDGLKGVEPYFQILKGDHMNLKIQNNAPGSKKSKQIQIFVGDNITLEALKKEISQKLEEKQDSISLFKGKRLYEDKFSGRSLADLKITRGDVIRVQRAKIPQALKVPLLNQSKTELSTKMQEVSKRIYSIYSDLQKGTILSKANFFKLCSDIAKADGKDDDAKKIAQQDNSSNKQIKFTQQQLNKQFLDRIKLKQQTVWKFIESLGIQQDLKIEHKEITKELPITAMPRHILATTHVYETLLKMLKNPNLSNEHSLIYKLLCSLPIYQIFKQEINNEWTTQNFNKSRSVFQIHYILGLIQSELCNNHAQDFSIQFSKSGVSVLIKYLQQYNFSDTTVSIYSLSQMEKVVISIILRILSGFIRIISQPDAFISQLYFQKVNQLQLDSFIQKINKKVQLNQHDVNFKKKFDENGIVVPVEQISQISYQILNNLIETYKQTYIKQIAPEIARLCSMLNQNSPHHMKTFLNGIKIQSINLRRTCTNLLYLRSSRDSSLLSSLLIQMLQNIPTENKSTSIQYFDLLTKLIELSIKENNQSVDFQKLAQELLNRVLNYRSDERRTSIIPDRVILGLLSVLNCIFSSKPELAASLVSYKWKLLNKCLFYPDPSDKIQQLGLTKDVINTAIQPQFFDDYLNIKTNATRAMLINVIVHLAKYHQQNQPDFLQAVLEPLLSQLPQKPKKSNTKGLMVGVQNLGAICYMSSMFQSLNTISGFRNGISMVNKQQSKLISATQKMLAYLLFSQRQDYTPSSFLEAFRQPINPNIQQDTTQFLNFYFDELQNQLQSTPYASLIRQLFQGSTVVQMICHNCRNKRQRKQEYYCYSIGVREKPTLELALEGMHEGDIINDYMCEACGVKSDLTKRSVLGDLPNFLFLHLQRIVNLDFYRYTKIHSKCLFPLQLNIEPFTKEGVELREEVGVEYLKKLHQDQEENKKFQQLCKHGKPDKYYTYTLKAIIVHSGSAEGGHYYTITRRQGGWAKLDDSKTTIFTLEQFQSECYGGPFTTIGEWGIEQSKNAYVLLYEKHQKSMIHLDFSEHPQQVQKFEVELDSAVNGIQYQKFKTYNTEALYKQVWMDNHRLMLQGHVFGDGHSKEFIKLIQNLAKSSNSPKKAQLISQVLLRISCWSNQIGNLMDEFQKCNPGYEIFQKYVKDLDNMLNLIFHNQKNIRIATSKFLTILCQNSIRQGHAEQIFKLLDHFISKLNTQVAKNWLRLQGYFDFLQKMVKFSSESQILYNYILSKNLISVLIDFILQKDSPLKISVKKHSMGNKFNNVQFGAGVKIIYWLLERSYYFNGVNDSDVKETKFHLSDNDVFALSSMNFYTKMIKEDQSVQEITCIIQRLSFDNFRFVEDISRNLLRILNDSMERLSQEVNIIKVIERFLLIKDSLWKKKAEFVLGVGQPYQIDKDNKFPSLDMDRFSYTSILEDIFPIQCVINLAFISRQRYPQVSLYLVRLMLRVGLSSQTATEYLKVQPPPNYLYTEYSDWWNSFVTFAFQTITTKTIKEQQLNLLKAQVSTLLQEWKSKPNPLPSNKNIITGKIDKVYKRIVTKFQTLAMTLCIQDSDVYAVPSYPSADNQSNQTFTKFLTHQRLEDANDSISSESNILKFMTTSKPALAITDNDNAQTSSIRAQAGYKDFIGPLPIDYYYGAQKDSDFNLWEDLPSQNKSQQTSQAVNNANKQTPASVKMQVENTVENKKQDTQQAKQKPMQIQYRVIDLEQPVSVIQYFRTITITNHSDESVWARINIQNIDYVKKNCIIPHLISGTVLAHKSQSYIFYKLDPSRDFADFDYNINVQESAKKKKKAVTPNFFKIYGDQNEQPVIEMEVEQPKQNEQQNLVPGGQGEGDFKICPVCTVMNQPTAETCECCESPFM